MELGIDDLPVAVELYPGSALKLAPAPVAILSIETMAVVHPGATGDNFNVANLAEQIEILINRYGNCLDVTVNTCSIA
jgi:hypothetical protein